METQLLALFSASGKVFAHLTRAEIVAKLHDPQTFLSSDRETLTGVITFHTQVKRRWYIQGLPKEQRVNALVLSHILVHEEYRRKGVGSELVRKVIGEGKRRNCSSIILSVHDRNKEAISFYCRLGFTKIAEYCYTSLPKNLEIYELKL